jgi:hypothetical protein
MRKTIFRLYILGVLFCSTRGNAEIKSNYHDNLPIDTTISAGIPDADALLQEILTVTGLSQNFEIRAADVSNVEAIIKSKKRLILYNPQFLDRLNKVTRSKWATEALIAHEVGHHLNGHTMKKTGSNIHDELEADEFAGFVLKKLGATLQQAQYVMLLIAKKEDSKTHPAQASRLEAIKRGFERAS